MANFLYSGTSGTLEEKYVTFDEMGFDSPSNSAGSLWGWGDNTDGQLGLNNVTNVSSPVQIGSLTDWKQVSMGGYHTTAIKTDGTLWSCGNNLYGQLGLNDTTKRSSPVQIGSLTNWKLVSCGRYHTTAIKTDGTLWVWGYNNQGQLGLNNVTNISSPVQVGTMTDWKTLTGNLYNTFSVKNDGSLWGWGGNIFGQLGLNDYIYRSSPVQIGSLTNWKQVSMSSVFSVAAIKTDGSLWGWGTNTNGQIGLGNTTEYSSPVQVGTMTNWKTLSTGGVANVLATKTDGSLWAWGYNYGGLGLGDSLARSSPIQVGSLTNWKSVSCSTSQGSSFAVKTDGTLWAFGQNASKNLGLGDNVSNSSPVQIGTSTGWKSVSTGYTSAIAIKY
jgi:alpha-tubulin suppressor-like RCC1 family protein